MRTTIAPTPTANATRLIEPERTSPAANTPGRLVSSGSGGRSRPSRARQAIKERAIDYPVALDNAYEIWSAFANRYWPALYFVDADGIIRDRHFGEGRYEQSERVIQRLLGVERDPVSVEAEADWDDLRTPETYLGYWRGERSRHRTARHTMNTARTSCRAPALQPWALAGEWTIGPRGSCSTRPAGASPTGSTRATHISWSLP